MEYFAFILSFTSYIFSIESQINQLDKPTMIQNRLEYNVIVLGCNKFSEA